MRGRLATAGWASANPRVADFLLALLVVLLLFPTSVWPTPADDDRALDAIGWLLMLIPSAALLFRRAHPQIALAIGTVLGFAYWVSDYPNGGASIAIVVLLYSAARYTTDRRRATVSLVVFTIVLLMVFTAGYFWDDENEVTLGLIIVNLIVFQLSWLAGDVIQHREARVSTLEDQVRRAEVEQARRTAEAVAAERSRIARELHDIVAHSMSVVIVQAEGAKRLVGKDDDAVLEALGAIESTGRTNLNDIRGVVGLLRDDDAELAPAAELSAIAGLVDHCAAAGLPVTLSVVGEPRGLPAMIELSGYRIVQESLTNAMKHAGPRAKAAITLDYGSDELRISVTDTGRGAAASREHAGYGLIGMRERVEAFGGELHAGPRTGGGFVVEANLPVSAP